MGRRILPRYFRARLRWLRNRPRYGLLVLLLWLAPLLGVGYLSWRVGWVSVHRIGVFHELEFQEGDMALDAMRLLDGKPLYPEREQGFIPLLYTPLTHYLGALSMHLTGERSLPAGRLVAVLATLGCLAALLCWIWRETRCPAATLFACGYFIGIAPLTGWWFDLYRVDMVFLCLTAWGSLFLLDRRRQSRMRNAVSKAHWAFSLGMRNKSEKGTDAAHALRTDPEQQTTNNEQQTNSAFSKEAGWEILKGIAGGACLALACLAKQTAAPLSLGFLGLAALISPLRAVWGLSMLLTVGGLLVLRELFYGADFLYYCWEVLLNHPMNLEDWRARLMREFFRPAAVALALAAGWLGWALWRRHWRRALAAPVLLMTIYLSCRSLLKIGGYVNHYLLAWFYLCLFLGVALGDLGARRGLLAPRGWLRAVVAPVLMFVAFAWLSHYTGALAWLGWREARAAGRWWPLGETDALVAHVPAGLDQGRQVIEAIRNLDGDVWVMHANFYAFLAGRPAELGIDNVRDLTYGGQPIPEYALNLLRERKYKYLLLNQLDLEIDWLDVQIRDLIRQNYVLVEDWETRFGWQALRPVDQTGQKPRSLWIRKEDLADTRSRHPQ